MCARAPPPRRNRRKSATWHFVRVPALKNILPEVAHDLPDGRVVDDRGFALTPTGTAYGDNTGNHTVITL